MITIFYTVTWMQWGLSCYEVAIFKVPTIWLPSGGSKLHSFLYCDCTSRSICVLIYQIIPWCGKVHFYRFPTSAHHSCSWFDSSQCYAHISTIVILDHFQIQIGLQYADVSWWQCMYEINACYLFSLDCLWFTSYILQLLCLCCFI